MAVAPKPQDMRQRLQALERRIRALESGRRLENASVGSTGVFQVGSTATGQPVLYLGTLNTVGGGGMEVRRADGSLALRVGKRDVTDTETSLALHDKTGNAAVRDSYAGNDGFDRPSLGLTMRPMNAVLDVAVAVTTWTDAFELHAHKFNAFLEGRFQAMCSDGTTAGEVRLTDGAGNPLLSSASDVQDVVAVPAGTTSMTRFVTQACVYPGPVHTTVMTVRLQVRRVSGTGTVTVRAGTFCGP